MSAQVHRSDAPTLDRRTLAADHRRLAALLRPGMRVLDVGCGTGAITAGIARAVGPDGSVVGIDRDATLLAHARARQDGVPGLRFEERDVLALDADGSFDVSTAARVLQWIERPADAVARMALAVRPGGWVVVLDYSHADLLWEPAPPPAMAHFFEAFLAWRTAHGWDNRMAHHLADLCAGAGLVDVTATVEDEVACRGEEGFDGALAIWQRVIVTMGPTMIAAGAIDQPAVDAAAQAANDWCRHTARRQHMVLRAVVGCRLEGGTP